MIKVETSRQLMIMLDHKVGTLAEIMSALAESGINLIAICAYEVQGKVAAMFVSEDNNEAKHLLEQHGLDVREEEVLLLSIDNKPGALRRITDRISRAGINLNLVYGSVDNTDQSSRIVMIAENNHEAQFLIKAEFERI